MMLFGRELWKRMKRDRRECNDDVTPPALQPKTWNFDEVIIKNGTVA